MRTTCKIFDAQAELMKGCFWTKKGKNFGAFNPVTGYQIIALKYRGDTKFTCMNLQKAIWCEAMGVRELPKGYVIHHISGVRTDCRIDNLSLVTPHYNQLRGAENRDYKEITKKRLEYGHSHKVVAKSNDDTMTFNSMSACARFFDCSPGRVSCNVNKQKYYNGLKYKDKVWIISRA